MGDIVHLVSGCNSLDEFIAAFRRYVDPGALFVPSAAPLPIGYRGAVALTLRDGAVVMSGQVEIISSSTRPAGRHGRAGMQLRWVELDAPSQAVFQHLTQVRSQTSLGPTPANLSVRPAALPPHASAPATLATVGVVEPVQALAECNVFASAPLSVASPLPSPAGLVRAAPLAPAQASYGRAPTPPPLPRPRTNNDAFSADSAPTEIVPAAAAAAASREDTRRTMMGFPALVAPRGTAQPPAAQLPVRPPTAPAVSPPAPSPQAPYIPPAPSVPPIDPQFAPTASVPVLPSAPANAPTMLAMQPMVRSPELAAAAAAAAAPELPTMLAMQPVVRSPELAAVAAASAPELPTQMAMPAVTATPPAYGGGDSAIPSGLPSMPGTPHSLPPPHSAPLAIPGVANTQLTTPVVRPSDGRKSRVPLILVLVLLAAAAGAAVYYFAIRPGTSATPATALIDAGAANPSDATAVPLDARASDAASATIDAGAAVADAGVAIPDAGGVAGGVAVADAGAANAVVVDAAPTTIDAPVTTVDAAPVVATPSGDECTVKFTSSPSGADVTKDGDKLGRTPFTVTMPCAATRVVFRKTKYASDTKSVRPNSKKAITVTARLSRPMVTMKVSSSPSGATVSVGKTKVGTTPTTIKVPANTTSTISVTKAGYKPSSKSVTVGDDAPPPAHFALKK